jgi:anti-anti-sigma regulatory factor
MTTSLARCVICAKDIEVPDARCPHCGNLQTFPDADVAITLSTFGTLDPEALDRIRAMVRANPPRLLLLDFDQVKVKNSAGYGRFMMLVREARKAGVRILIRKVDPLIQEMFKLTRIDGELEIE